LPRSALFFRRLIAGGAASALSLGLLGAVGTTAEAADPDVAWTVTPVAGGYLVTLALDEPLPMVDDAPTLLADGVDLGPATESADSLSLSLVTTDDSVADADSVEAGWDSGDDAKVEPTDSPVTSSDLPVAKSGRPARQQLQDLAASDDGSTPGPYGYVQDDYDYGDQADGTAGLGGIRQELTGRIYLTTAPGERPTVILLHGRHTSCSTVVAGTQNPNRWPCVAGQTEVPSYKGYDGTGQTLATWGYNVVSISANSINANDAQLSVDNGALARGQLVIDSLEMIKKWNAGDPAVYHDNALNRDQSIAQALDAPQADLGTTDLNQINPAWLVGSFDLDHVGLMGHSRGGEGVTQAVALNQALAQPFGIESVLPLAPVDFTRMTVGDVPMLLMLPYCDGDVSNQQGQHFIDDSRYAHDDSVLKSTVWVMGANHNFFNSVWTPGKYGFSTSDDWGATSTDAVCGPAAATNIRLSADDQYKVGTAYMTAWFRMTVSPGEPGFLPRFDGSTKPVVSSVPTADIRVLAEAPAEGRADIEPFTAFDGRVRNFGSATATVCASASGRTLPQPLPYCGTTSTLRSTSAMPHWTPASFAPNVPASPMTKLLWTSTTGSTAGSIRVTVPAAARNAAAYDALVFKTAPDESVLTGTDLTLTVVDGSGATWSSLVSALNPLAVKRLPTSTSTTLNKIVLQQVSVPVASMTGIDTGDIREVRIAGAVGADATPAGGVYLTDLALADSSIGTPELLSSAATINVDPTTVEEGNSSADAKSVAVVLSKAVPHQVTGWLTLIGSTAAGAKAGLAASQVTFSPGSTCQAVEVPTFGDSAMSSAATTSFKTEVSNQTGVVYGAKAFGTLAVREDDGLTSGTPAAPVGVQGDVCAEYAAKSQLFALTASVTEPAPGGTVTLTGAGFRAGESVAFTDGSTTPATVLGSVVATGAGAVSLDVPLPADAALGARTFSATGAGSGRKEAVDVSVLAPTTTLLSSTPATPAIKEAVTLTATVTGASTAGTVEFKDGTSSLGSAPVTGGTATLSLPSGFLAGDHSLTAAFAKTATASASTSNALAFTLVKGATTTVVALSAPATTFGTGATGTITVGGADGGSVALTMGGSTSTLPLDGTGHASFPLPADLAPGSYPLAVEYAGTDTVASSSTSASYTVTKAAPTLAATVVKVKKPHKKGKKAKATVSVTVGGVAGVTGPSGTVTLTWGSVHQVVTLPAGGVVTVTLAKKNAKGAVQVAYSGDADYQGSGVSAPLP
jgi:hypothetical protein